MINRCEQQLVNAQTSVNRAVFSMNKRANLSAEIIGHIKEALQSLNNALEGYQVREADGGIE